MNAIDDLTQAARCVGHEACPSQNQNAAQMSFLAMSPTLYQGLLWHRGTPPVHLYAVLGRPAGQQSSRDRFDAWTAGGSDATNAHTETGLFLLIPG